VLGAQAVEPGWKQARIRPTPGNLEYAKGKIPTPLGIIDVAWENKTSFQMKIEFPPGMTAKLEVPASANSKGVKINGEAVTAKRNGTHWHVHQTVSGSVNVVAD
jgi:hypothetical protein